MARIGQVIKHLRQQQGLSLGALARKTGISKTALSQIESDSRKNPRTDTLERIAAGLNMESVDIFFNLSVRKSEQSEGAKEAL